MNNIAIFGSTGAIGHALITEFAKKYPQAHVHAIARSNLANSQLHSPLLTMDNVIHHSIDINDEEQLKNLAKNITKEHKLDYVFVAIGLLHDDSAESPLQPEKSLRNLSADNFERIFTANTIVPSIIAKHFLPKLNKSERSVFAALSARVGSISDNRLGGWYAYRASKTALNMIIKTASIEVARSNPKAILVTLHPGTVDSNLSKPFQRNVAEGKLFTAEFSAQSLIKVTDELTAEDTGKSFAWDGVEITP